MECDVKMPNPEKVHVSSLNKKNFNILLFFNFFIAFVGSVFLAWNGVTAGIVYSFMFVGIISLIFMVTLFLRDDNSLKPITDFAKIPISTSLGLASLFYLVGMLIPAVVKGVLGIFKTSFSITSLSIPLFGTQITSAQSFSTVEIGASMPWRIFNIMFTAGNMETLVFNFGTIIVGVLIGWFTLKLINGGEDLGFISKKTFILGFAFAVSVLLFLLSHLMNQTYMATQFFVAGVFLLVANFSIYLAGVFLSFWAGYHQSSNLFYLIEVDGFVAVAEGFVSWFGLLFLVYLALIIFYVIRNWDTVKAEFSRWLGS